MSCSSAPLTLAFPCIGSVDTNGDVGLGLATRFKSGTPDYAQNLRRQADPLKIVDRALKECIDHFRFEWPELSIWNICANIHWKTPSVAETHNKFEIIPSLTFNWHLDAESAREFWHTRIALFTKSGSLVLSDADRYEILARIFTAGLAHQLDSFQKGVRLGAEFSIHGVWRDVFLFEGRFFCN